MNLKKRNYYFLIIVLLLVTTILIGASIEYFVYRGYHLFTVNNFNNISLTLAQIQATMVTLLIAVIALLSGTISKSYFGISVNSFYLEIKPRLLRFKIVLIYEFILIGLSLIGHSFEYYNFVVTSFTFSTAIILLFVLQIFDVYKGENNVISEIKSYFNKRIEENDKEYKNLGLNFIGDWKNIATVQSQQEFNEYFQLYIKLISKIIINNKDTEIVNFLNISMAKHLLQCDNIQNKIKGIEFVINCYSELSNLFLHKAMNTQILGKPINLICCVEKEWRNTFISLNLRTIENLKVRYFLRNVLLVSAYSNNRVETEITYEIGYSLGFILDIQRRQDYKINSYWWSELVNHQDFNVQIAPKQISKDFLISLAILNFNVCKGYLLNGQTNLVKHALFQGMLYTINYRVPTLLPEQFFALVIEVLLVHCFMYLISFRIESTSIKSSIQTEIKKLITDNDVIKNAELFFWELIQRPQYLTKEVKSILEGMINEYQSYNNDEHLDAEIECVEQGVVKEYFLYVVLMVNRFGNSTNTNILEVLDTTEYQCYASESIQNSISVYFSELSKVLAPHYSDPCQMLHSFKLYMRKKIKEYRIQRALQTKNEFLKNDIQVRLKKIILDKFSEYFEKVSIPYGIPNQNIHTYDEHLATIRDYTECLKNEISAIYLDETFVAIMKCISKILKEEGVVEKNRLNDFKKDNEFIDFIEKQNYDILIGGLPALSQKDFKDPQTYSDFLNSKNLKIIPYSKFAIVTTIGEIYIKLEDIRIDIRSANIEQINPNEYTKNDDTGLIVYPKDHDLNSDYDESEFKELIKNERIITNIDIRLTIGINTHQDLEQKHRILLIKGPI